MNSETHHCDLVVIGSGASGLAAAVTAAWLGLEVIVIEKYEKFGGTSAWSGGWLWVPRNYLAKAAGINEDIGDPLNYLRNELGNNFDERIARQYLEYAPLMLDFFRNHTSVNFVDGNAIPDFHEQLPGAGKGGRSVCAAPFDGRKLGNRIHDLRSPLDLISPFGMGIASGADLRHFLNLTRKLKSFIHVTSRLSRHFIDRIFHGRGMHLVNGNALIARLLKSADDFGVLLFKSMPARDLIIMDGHVAGIKAGINHELTILARRGVILATGGFPHDLSRKADLFPHAPTGMEHFSAATVENTGDGIRLGERAGGVLKSGLPHAGAWAPVSRVPCKDESTRNFPHLIERAKPGLIMVRNDGRRFTNEANSYHDVMNDLFAATPADENVECWMICDHMFQRRYGLGRTRPWPFPLWSWIANGYLKRGKTICDLAVQCGIDTDSIKRTIESYNKHAQKGKDPEFHRGESSYNRIQGDAEHMPNPCVAPIKRGPFYAVKVVPGSLGTFAGLSTNADMQVLNGKGDPISGLFAVGNDQSSMMAGRYPAGGITLGPGMTCGYIAAHRISGVPLDNDHSRSGLV
ncbi:MAG: FAD-dependent oxidoreductase [Beijerinckiaceae bacterium]